MSPFGKRKVKEYAVIGLGRFGASLTRRLENLGHHVLGIDIDPRLVKEVSDEITEAVILDATDEDALRQVDITSFKTVVVAVSSNFEAKPLFSVVSCFKCKTLFLKPTLNYLVSNPLVKTLL